MNEVKAQIGNLNVIASGGVLSNNDETIKLSISIDPHTELDFNFGFRSKEDGKKHIVAESTEETGIVTLWLENFTQGTTGPSKPTKVAESEKNELWLLFVVMSSDDQHLLHYTFYIKPKRTVKAKKVKKNGKRSKGQ